MIWKENINSLKEQQNYRSFCKLKDPTYMYLKKKKKNHNTSLVYGQLEASLSYILKHCIKTTGTTKTRQQKG